MGLKAFTIYFKELSNINSILLTTRIKKYCLNKENGYLPFSYFIDNQHRYSIGQIKKESYKEDGKVAIIDQSQNIVSGYSNKENLVYNGSLPVIIFGDHTRIFKYIDFPFIQGADGIKIIKPNESVVNPKFFYYLLSKYGVPSRGYNRHFTILKKQKYPLIKKETQERIIDEIDHIEKNIVNLKDQVREQHDIINNIFARMLGFDENLFNDFGKGMTAGTQIAKDRDIRLFQANLGEIVRSNILRFSTRYHNTPTKILMDLIDTINTFKIKDILTEPIHRGATPEYNPNGNIPVVKTAHLKNGYIVISQEEFVNYDYYNSSTRSQIKKGDILLASTGKVSLGKIDLMSHNIKAVADSHVSIIRINKNKYNSLFFTYFFRSILGYFQIERDYTGTTNQIELYPDDISTFLIPGISLDKQKIIVDEIKAELGKQRDIKKQIEIERNKIDEIIENAVK